MRRLEKKCTREAYHTSERSENLSEVSDSGAALKSHEARKEGVGKKRKRSKIAPFEGDISIIEARRLKLTIFQQQRLK